MSRPSFLAALLVILACTAESRTVETTAKDSAASNNDHSASQSDATGAPQSNGSVAYKLSPADSARTPNELGRIPVVEYHIVGDSNSRWGRERGQLRRDMELLYQRGYRPVTISQLLDRKINLPRGLSPVVFVFDDASPGQFSYVDRDGKLEIDPGSAVGIWMDFRRTHPDWDTKAVFCMLPAAQNGHAFFGEKGIKGQKSEWRFPKVQYLAKAGFELCNHTLWHAKLSQYPDPFVQEQIARGQMAIDSAVPNHPVRTFALPLGLWPKNRALAWAGSWTDPKSGKTIQYKYDAVLEVSGGPTRSPYDPAFNPHSINRIEVFGTELERTLDMLERRGRYVSDGNPDVVARPANAQSVAPQ